MNTAVKRGLAFGLGMVVGGNAGITEVTAEYQGASGSVSCTVGP